jgi:hypothetical protein
MKISKPHQRFANILNNQRVLSHPEEFLGPNWKEVLNFWIYLDTLSDEQLDIAEDRYEEAPSDDLDIVDNVARETLNACSAGVTYFFISNCTYWSVHGHLGGLATRELIGAHMLLKQGKPLTFTSLLINQNYS